MSSLIIEHHITAINTVRIILAVSIKNGNLITKAMSITINTVRRVISFYIIYTHLNIGLQFIRISTMTTHGRREVKNKNDI